MSSLEDDLKMLRAHFVEGVTERLGTIRDLITKLESADEVAEGKQTALEDLLRHFHNLAGAGMTFGFPKISEIGKRTELECVALRERQTLPDAVQLSRWREAVEDIRLHLQK
jgi:chemotaxis protein histidine kinase CheA